MPIKARLFDAATGKTADNIVATGRSKNSRDQHHKGLVVFSERLLNFEPRSVQFVSSSLGAGMNVNAALSGSPVAIHDGTDTALWTGSEIVGTSVTFDSTALPETGLKSVLVDAPALNDVWEFDKGGAQALGAYAALSMKVNIDANWTSGDSIELYGWDGAEVGTRVAIEDYIDEFLFDAWQNVVIPLGDMTLTTATVTGFRMQLVGKHGQSPILYIDEFQIEETGTVAEFKSRAPTAEAFHVSRIRLTLAGPLTAVFTDLSLPGLAYDKILGLATLSNGLLLEVVQNQIIMESHNVKSLADFVGIGYDIREVTGDGTNTLLVLELVLDAPIVLRGSGADNYLVVHVADDLSTLLRFTAVAFGASEVPE